MAVISGRKVIFCEGKAASLDYKLLDKIISDAPDRPTIVPAGGKFTFRIFAEGYYFPVTVDEQRYIIFRDRDFDVTPTSDVQLLQITPHRNIYVTHRACIENYLLDAELIHDYWTAKNLEKQEYPSSKWSHQDSPGLDAIFKWIETSARQLADYQAVRWALSGFLQMPEARRQLRTTWTGGSGKLPDSLVLDDCCQQALLMVEKFKAATELVTTEQFQRALDQHRTLFQSPDFWDEQQYFIWFHGKDLAKEMQRQQNHYISLANYFEWAVQMLDLSQHADLADIKVKIYET